MKNTFCNRREFLQNSGAVLAGYGLAGCVNLGHQGIDSIDRPNVIVIFTDDQGYGDVGCYGAKGFETPNLDRLATEGVRFTDFYVAATVCTPSRAALLTGCYPKRVGMHEAVLYPHSDGGLHPDEVTIPEVLKQSGYVSGCIGKWHLGHLEKFLPLEQGFDEFFGVPYSNDMDGYYYRAIDFQSPPLPLYQNNQLIEEGPDQRFLTQRYTEQAVDFIRRHRDRRFFLYIAHSMPHLPLHVSPSFAGKSELGLYGDVMMELDWSVGQIMQSLEQLGLEENTLVIFTSDNGPVIREKSGSAGPLRGGKATTWEGGQRVPCIVRWPKQIPAGTTCSALVTTMDIFPTVATAACASVSSERTIDGKNILHILKEPTNATSPHDAFYYYSRNGSVEAVRSGSWKLHIAKSRGWDQQQGPFPVSLYDLQVDIAEKNNVAEQYPAVVIRLQQKIADFDADLSRNARPKGLFDSHD